MIRQGRFWRIASIVLALVVVLSCSSLSSITAYNKSDQPVDLKVSDEQGETWKGRIEPNGEAEVWKRYGGPNALKFELGNQALTYNEKTMPASLAHAGSGGTMASWYWDGRLAWFEADEVSILDRTLRSGLILGCGGPIAIAFGLVALSRGWFRRPERKSVTD